MELFLFDDSTIIASDSQKDAENLYLQVNGEFENVEKINDDYVIGANQNYNNGGYDEIHLFSVLEEKPLPYIVDIEGY
jgi:hypothetical protein